MTQYYGQSAIPEDKIAHSVFGDDFVGTCVEVGAYNGIDLSNTYFFYLRGWRCINFEPHPDNYAALCINQPNAINLDYAAIPEWTPKEVTIKTAPGKPIVTGLDLPSWYVKSEVNGGFNGLVDMEVKAMSIDAGLVLHGIKHVDYVSIDTDGTEMQVLMGFGIEAIRPRLMIIEYNHVFTEMTSYLREYGYQLAHDNGLNGFWTRTQADYDAVRRAVR